MNPLLKQLKDDGLKQVGVLFAYAYFLYWFLKFYVRYLFQYTSFAVFGLPPLITLLEVLEKFVHIWPRSEVWFQNFHKYTESHAKTYAVVSLLAAVYLVVHYIVESRKPAYEYHFVNRYLKFSEKVGGGKSTLTVSDLLELFFHCFARAKIKHIAVRRMSGGKLTVDPNDIYPKGEASLTFFASLPEDKGVAALVYKDKCARYVPRLFWPFSKKHKYIPTIYFPHAVKFELKLKKEETKLVTTGLNRDAFYVGDDKQGKEAKLEFPFLSLLSVPLLDHENKCVGILNFDFDKTDPLDRDDISMAVAIGRIIADEVSRIAPVATAAAAPAATTIKN
jgi:hypothetical protein